MDGKPPVGRVLVVDDQSAVAAVLSDVLSRLGYAVKTAASGRAGLDAMAVFEPDVVLLDIQMPGMTGLEVLDVLRSHHPGVNVVMMSGNGDEEVEQSTLLRGAHAYVQKPIDLHLLERTVAGAMAGRMN